VADKLPSGCFVTQSDVITRQQTDAIGKKLGAPLKKLSNTYLQIHGKPIQVNVLEAKTGTDAKKLHKTVSKMKNHPAFCLLRGKKVIEFCKSDISTAIKTAYELGFTPKPKQVQYDLTAHLSTVDKADYMDSNNLFNVFLKTNTQNPSKESIAQIRELSHGFVFGKSLVLRKESEKLAVYEFNPRPAKTTSQSFDQVLFTFQQTPNILGVPYVTFNARVICNNTGKTPTTRKAEKSLLSATFVLAR